MELVLRCPYSLIEKNKSYHLIKEPLTTPCCGKTFCRDCLPKYLSSLTVIDNKNNNNTNNNKKIENEDDVLLCECGARLSKEDRQILSHSCSNQALVSVIQTYRSFLSRLSSSFLLSSNLPPFPMTTTPTIITPTTGTTTTQTQQQQSMGFSFSSILNSR